MSKQPQKCRCRSSNNPEKGGDQPEVVVPGPDWSWRETICLDACIADAVQMLWAHGIQTAGSCCGHNLSRPNVVLPESARGEGRKHKDDQCRQARALLQQHDGRDWEVLQWRLVLVDRRWKKVDLGVAPCRCGNATPEVFTDAPGEMVWLCDPVRCPDCGATGQIDGIDDEAWVIWDASDSEGRRA